MFPLCQINKNRPLLLIKNHNVLLKIIEELIKQYLKECQDDQYALLKHFFVLIFSQQLEKIEVAHSSSKSFW